MPDLAATLTAALLIEVAGPTSFARGLAYANEDRVGPIAESSRTIAAEVRGKRRYEASLWAEEPDRLDPIGWDCSCPVGESGDCCKHCVALGMTWLQRRAAPDQGSLPDLGPTTLRQNRAGKFADTSGREFTSDSAWDQARQLEAPLATRADASTGRRRLGEPTDEGIRDYLESLGRAELAGLLMSQADSDVVLRQRLQARTLAAGAISAARAAGGSRDVDPRPFARAILRAIAVSDYVRYREAPAYADRIHAALDALGDLLADGHARAVIEVAERILPRVQGIVERIDDSDGHVAPIFRRVYEFHLAACNVAAPESIGLARQLFQWELDDEYGFFSGAVRDYADVLGDDGLAEYRRLADAAWRELPPLGKAGKAGIFDEERYGVRFRITAIMETLAEMSGDVDGLVAVKSADLAAPYSYLEIAEVLASAGRRDEALSWAEQGLQAFPTWPDSRLLGWLTDEYFRLGRDTDAVELAWQGFAVRPDWEGHGFLRETAERAGAWSGMRERALLLMREEAEQPGAPRQPAFAVLLARVLLEEGEVDAAWEAACSFAVPDWLWLRLADARVVDHPGDAIPIYHRAIDEALRSATQAAYDDVTDLLLRLRRAMELEGRGAEFAEYLSSVRDAYRRRPNFQKTLRGAFG